MDKQPSESCSGPGTYKQNQKVGALGAAMITTVAENARKTSARMDGTRVVCLLVPVRLLAVPHRTCHRLVCINDLLAPKLGYY